MKTERFFAVFHNAKFLDHPCRYGRLRDSLLMEHLTLAAIVVTPRVADVFRLTNNIDEYWWNNPEVVKMQPGSTTARSTSVGDVLATVRPEYGLGGKLKGNFMVTDLVMYSGTGFLPITDDILFLAIQQEINEQVNLRNVPDCWPGADLLRAMNKV